MERVLSAHEGNYYVDTRRHGCADFHRDSGAPQVTMLLACPVYTRFNRVCTMYGCLFSGYPVIVINHIAEFRWVSGCLYKLVKHRYCTYP